MDHRELATQPAWGSLAESVHGLPAGPRGQARLALLEQLLAVGYWVGLVLALGPWPAYRGPRELGPLASSVATLQVATALFLAAHGLWHWRMATLVRNGITPPAAAWGWTALRDGVVTILVLLVLSRGANSRALLTGPVALLPTLLTVSGIAMGVAMHGAWSGRGRQDGSAESRRRAIGDFAEPGQAVGRGFWFASIATTLGLLLTLVWLEAQPVPVTALSPLARETVTAPEELRQ